MKKYIAIQAFATNKQYLVINGDIVYGKFVNILGCIHFSLYHPESRQYIGSLEIYSADKIPEYLKEQP